jgi:uncharacterized protein YjbI with pentapeptide repeats
VEQSILDGELIGYAPKMPDPAKPAWPTCQALDCRGRRLDGADRCLAHAHEDDRTAALERITEGAPVDVAAGARFTEELLSELLAALPRDDAGHPVLNQADFREAMIPAIKLDEASFQGTARFDYASFQGDAGFRNASFQGDAWFPNTSFQDDASFDRARFQGNAGFSWARFQGFAGFGGARLQLAGFYEASFQGYANFYEASFGGAFFASASFHDYAGFGNTTFEDDASFSGAHFERHVGMNPVAVAGVLGLDRVVFDHRVDIEVAAWRLLCRWTRFRAGGHLRVAWAEITLQAAEISSPLIISQYSPAPELVQRSAWLAEGEEAARFLSPMPSLVSVQRADVAGLVVSDVDLRDCHFTDAHHLDQLQIATADAFHHAPARWGWAREVLAEECEWRQARGGWRVRRWQHTSSELFRSPLLEDERRPEPSELAGLYRRLRKGQEDIKNEPGAASFYYGEMEMRRHAAGESRSDRALLGLYWLVSGYALRAGRALTTLLVALLLTSGLMMVWGLPQPVGLGASVPGLTGTLAAPAGLGGQRIELLVRESDTRLPRTAIRQRLGWARWWQAVWVSANGAVFRTTAPTLTVPGKITEMLLRVLGPVLLGLVLLSVRNRVKR